MSLEKLYPFHSHFLKTADSLAMHYIDEGPKDAEVVLMVHGNPSWSFLYRNLILSLKEKYRCIAIDHIGCGLSDKPQNYNYTLEQHIDNLVHCIDTLGLQKIHLVVHDWGGPIGIGALQRRLHLLDRIVILNTSLFLSSKIPWRIRLCKMPIVGDILVRGLNAFACGATWMAVKKRMPSPIKKAFCFPYNTWQNRIATLRFIQDIPTQPTDPSFAVIQSIEHSLDLVKVRPTLVCWGMQDFCFNEHYLNLFKKHWPQAYYKQYPHAGHYLLEDAPEAIEDITQFLLAKNSY